jgi:hypothetical protein
LIVAAISFGLYNWKQDTSDDPGHEQIIPDPNAGKEPSPVLPTAEAILKTITVDTMDGTAQVIQEEKPIGSTPFQVKAHIGERISMVLRRSGFEDLPIQFDVSEHQVYTYVLVPRKDR